MSEEKSYTVKFDRRETVWLHKELSREKDVALKNAQIANQNGKHDEQAKLVTYADELTRFTNLIKDGLNGGTKEFLAINAAREELEEAKELVEDAAVIALIDEKLKELKKDEVYKITFNRETIKFTLKIVEDDLQRYRHYVIPSYQKKDDSAFTDPIQTKKYWVNKSIKAKTILEALLAKLEKEL
jgi:hypothetical protein